MKVFVNPVYLFHEYWAWSGTDLVGIELQNMFCSHSITLWMGYSQKTSSENALELLDYLECYMIPRECIFPKEW